MPFVFEVSMPIIAPMIIEFYRFFGKMFAYIAIHSKRGRCAPSFCRRHLRRYYRCSLWLEFCWLLRLE
ncbi:MAG: hypothetical protein Q4B96_07245, partial [Bacillota bacterium]|nr:hypothetical protein [Bacillota bacterium]